MGISKFLFLFVTYLKICPAIQDFRKRNYDHDTYTPPAFFPFLSAPCSGDPLAALGRPHVIGSGNYEQTELTMEPTPKTPNELYCDPYGSKYIRGSEEL